MKKRDGRKKVSLKEKKRRKMKWMLKGKGRKGGIGKGSNME